MAGGVEGFMARIVSTPKVLAGSPPPRCTLTMAGLSEEAFGSQTTHQWNAGRRFSCIGHERMASGFAFGPRSRRLSRDLLDLSFAERDQCLNALLARMSRRHEYSVG